MLIDQATSEAPLSDDEYDFVEAALAADSPYDLDGLHGVLHAVAVAPGMIAPSQWLPLVFPNGPTSVDSTRGRELIDVLLRLYNAINAAVQQQLTITPDPDDVESARSFARGYASAAALDPLWIGDASRWTFAAYLAHFGGRDDLVPESVRMKIEAQGDLSETASQQLGALVLAAYDSFLRFRQELIRRGMNRLSPPPSVRRVGRNDTCPCGSGKKHKRCCLNARDAQ